MRIAFPLLLLFASFTQAEDILQPTNKELINITDFDLKAKDRDKLIEKYDGKLVKVVGSIYYGQGTGQVLGGTGSFRFLLEPPNPVPNALRVCIAEFGPNTEKLQKQIKENASNTKPFPITLYARLRVGKTERNAALLEGATTEKDNAGKKTEPEAKK